MIQLFSKVRRFRFLPAAIALLLLPSLSFGQEVVVQPAPDSVFTGRKPVIESAFTADVDTSSLIVLLDGMDITQASVLSPDNISYTSPVPVGGGLHTVEVLGTNADGTPLYISWSFTVQHSEKYDEIGFNSDITASYSVNVDEKEELSPLTDRVLEGSGPLNFHVKKDGREFSLAGNLYYYQQDDEPGLGAADEGGDFRNFLLTGRWKTDRSVKTLEVGDLGIDETYYTALNLYRRGARFSLDLSRKSFSLFSLSSAPVVGVRDGLDVGVDTDENIIGTSFRATSADGRTGLHIAYLTGREESGYGVSLPGDAKEGDVIGVVLGRTLIPAKLSLHLEGASSSFDSDLTDAQGEEGGWAVFTGLTWMAAPKLTVKASAERVGKEFRSIGAPDALNDFDKVSLTGDLFLKKHTLNLATSWSRSNVEDDAEIPVSTQMALDAMDTWLPKNNLSLQTRLYTDSVDTSGEPAGFDPFSTRTDILSTLVNYNLTRWSLGTFLSLSRTDDTTGINQDTKQEEVRLDLAYNPSSRFSASITLPQFIRDRDDGAGVDYETLNTSALVNAVLYGDALTFDLSANRGLFNASDDSADQVSTTVTTRLAYSFSSLFPEYSSPSVILGSEHSRTVDEVADTDMTQYRVFLTLELRSRLTY